MGSLFKVTEIRGAAFIICLVLLVFTPFAVHAQDTPTGAPVVLVQPESVTVNQGDVFNVSVVIENLPANDGMCGAEFQLTWNATMLSALSMDEVVFHEITPQDEWGNIWQIRKGFNNTVGFAEYAYTWLDKHRAIDGGYFPVNGISGNHTLAIITMKAVGAGSTNLHLQFVEVGDMSANALIDVGEMMHIDCSDNYYARSQPTPMPENGSTTGVPVVLVQPESATVNQGDVFNVSVVIENLPASDGMDGAEFQLTWNATMLSALSMDEVVFHEITPQDEWGNIWQIQKTFNNTIGIAEYTCLLLDIHRAIDRGYFPVNGISGNHTLAIITMKAVGAGSTNLHLQYVKVCDRNANVLIYVGEMMDLNPRRQPPPMPENGSSTTGNWTISTVDPCEVPMFQGSSQENVTEIQKQDAPEVTDVPFVILATIGGMFMALPASWRRTRREH